MNKLHRSADGHFDSIANDLERLCPGGIARDVPLARISRWRIGGLADLIVRPESSEQLSAVRQYFHLHNLHHVVIGATSNLLFADEGLHVPCIQIGAKLSSLNVEGDTAFAEAGVWVPALARSTMQAGVTGAEHICGIPGTLGGLICMNGGSQRRGIGTAVVEVASIDITGALVRRTAAECAFTYRQSVFQSNNEIIVHARLRFRYAVNKRTVRREMLEILKSRRQKFPQKIPNCGSVFKSDPAMYTSLGPPGAVIERLGFKGRTIGGAFVSPQHANFILNAGSASASDVLALILEIRAAVRCETGFMIEPEVRFVTSSGQIIAIDFNFSQQMET